ncbi:MAG TPA: sugar phosphate isomerase/epimerase [Bacillota bacterium]|nr:sugar phosphate isomerase/epimerase [Clostridiales bacterium]HPT85635.1 sugar phosphate isomerase/epimerase [Bacillota bacterium]
MKIGLSSYSLVNRIYSGEMSVLDVMQFAADNGAKHFELVPFGYKFYDDETGQFDEGLIEAVRAKSAELGLPLSNYAVLADLLKPTEAEREAERERLKRHIDVAAKLGVPFMRHDVSSFRRPLELNTPAEFERLFPLMVEQTRELSEYAAQYGITTLVENHGFFVNGGDRLVRLAEAVGRENFGVLCDIGNFACVDEDCLVAVKKVLPYTKFFHLKDFYIRKTEELPLGGGLFRCDSGNWFSTNSGEYMLRGSILGQGDLPVRHIFRAICEYAPSADMFGSLEFEGMEAPEDGSRLGMATAEALCAR